MFLLDASVEASTKTWMGKVSRRDQAYHDGELDAMLSAGPPVDAEVMVPLGVAVAADHPLSALTLVHPSDSRDHDVLLLDDEDEYRDWLHDHRADHAIGEVARKAIAALRRR